MPLRAVVITISDRCARGAAVDQSGPAVIERLSELDAALVHREVVPDEIDEIRRVVGAWIGRADVIVSTGGTGAAPRDVTPEALAPLIERPLPGFGEVMRLRGFDALPTSILSRGGAGTAGATLIVWLPGSPRAVKECLGWLATAIRHACRLLRGDDVHAVP